MQYKRDIFLAKLLETFQASGGIMLPNKETTQKKHLLPEEVFHPSIFKITLKRRLSRKQFLEKDIQKNDGIALYRISAFYLP